MCADSNSSRCNVTFYSYVCHGLIRFENCRDFHGFGMVLWSARNKCWLHCNGDKQLIHGDEERVAVGTHQESGCHVLND